MFKSARIFVNVIQQFAYDKIPIVAKESFYIMCIFDWSFDTTITHNKTTYNNEMHIELC
jgi:hypothetical protein